MKINKIDLNLLVVFDAIYRTRSTTRAGAELHLTQSAVSNALRRLRVIIGEPLFIRTGRGLVPTEVSMRLAGPVQDSLGRMERALDNVHQFDPSRVQQTFRLYMSDTGQVVALPKLLAQILTLAPGIRVETIATSPREARLMMEENEVDLAFGYFEGFGAGVARERLFEERYTCVVRQDHPSIRQNLTLTQFFDNPHVVYRPTAGSHAFFESMVDQLFAEHGRRKNVALRLSHGLGIAEILRETDLLALIPGRLAAVLEKQGGLRVLEPPFSSPRFDICLYWLARRQSDVAHTWLRSLLRLIFADQL